MRYIDLTQTFTASMPVYAGDPVPRLVQTASLEHDGQTNFEITASMHVGTHVDGPQHMIPCGRRLVDFPPETFFGKAAVIDARGRQEIGEQLLENFPPGRADVILLCTGWAEKYGSDTYYRDYPTVTEGFARQLIARGVKILGIDGPSPDHPPFPVHKILLQNEILIIENLANVIGLIGAGDCEIIVAPLKIEADSAPARVIVRVA